MSNELVPYADIEKMGKAVSSSGLFGVKTEAQAIALMLIAQAYGQHPAIAAMEYHIIAGKPSKKSEAMLASFIQSGGKVQWHKLDDTIADATFSHPSGGELRLTWDIKMAEKAGLLAKEGTLYRKYPRAMLRSRLIAEGVRTIYPAATGGMLAKEELEDMEELKPEVDKSRVESIVESQVEEAQIIKPDSATKTEVKTKKDTPAVKSAVTEEKEKLPEGIKEVIGIFDWNQEKMCHEKEIHGTDITNPFTGKQSDKWVFKIDGIKYGTFEEKIAKEILKVIDYGNKTQRAVLIKIQYSETRPNAKEGGFHKDIVKFSQAVANKDVPV